MKKIYIHSYINQLLSRKLLEIPVPSMKPITIRVRWWRWEWKKTFWIKERRLDADSSLFNHTLAPVNEMIMH